MCGSCNTKLFKSQNQAGSLSLIHVWCLITNRFFKFFLYDTLKWPLLTKQNCSRWSKRETHCWNAFREAENHLGLYLIVTHVLWELFVLAWHTHTSACNTGRNNFDSHLMSLLYCCRHAGICFEVDNLLPTEQFENNLPERTVSKHWRFHP